MLGDKEVRAPIPAKLDRLYGDLPAFVHSRLNGHRPQQDVNAFRDFQSALAALLHVTLNHLCYVIIRACLQYSGAFFSRFDGPLRSYLSILTPDSALAAASTPVTSNSSSFMPLLLEASCATKFTQAAGT